MFWLRRSGYCSHKYPGNFLFGNFSIDFFMGHGKILIVWNIILKVAWHFIENVKKIPSKFKAWVYFIVFCWIDEVTNFLLSNNFNFQFLFLMWWQKIGEQLLLEFCDLLKLDSMNKTLNRKGRIFLVNVQHTLVIARYQQIHFDLFHNSIDLFF